MSTLYIVKVGDLTLTYTDELSARRSYESHVEMYPSDKIKLLEYKEPSNIIEEHLPEKTRLTKVIRCCRCNKIIEFGEPIFVLKSNSAPLGYSKYAYFCSNACLALQVERLDASNYAYKDLPEWVKTKVRDSESCT